MIYRDIAPGRGEARAGFNVVQAVIENADVHYALASSVNQSSYQEDEVKQFLGLCHENNVAVLVEFCVDGKQLRRTTKTRSKKQATIEANKINS